MRYTYEPRLTREVTGQFLTTPRGPREALRLAGPAEPVSRRRAASPRAATSLRSLRPRRGGGRPGRLPALRPRPRVAACRCASSRRAARRSFASRRRGCRAPGRYAFVATHEGMFGGRDFAYLHCRRARRGRHVRSRPARTRQLPRSRTRCCRSLRPSSPSLFSALLLASFARRPAGQKLFWGAASPSSPSPRWLRGGRAAQRLDAGALPHLLPRGRRAHGRLPRRGLRLAAPASRGRDILVGALATAATAATVAVFLAPVDARRARGDRKRQAARQRCARRSRRSLGDRAEQLRDRVPRRRVALLGSPTAAGAGERLDRPAARSSSPSPPACRAPATTRSSTWASSSGSRSCSPVSASPALHARPRRLLRAAGWRQECRLYDRASRHAAIRARGCR